MLVYTRSMHVGYVHFVSIAMHPAVSAHVWAHQVKMGACAYDYNLRKWRLKIAVFAQGG